MRDLNVTIVQSDIVWEDISANLARFDEKMDSLAEKTDVIILPEMFATGFTMNVEKVAQPMAGPAVSWLVTKAKQKHAHVMGSLIVQERKKYFNRLVWATPSGNILTYDKKHLFRMAGEHKIYSPGKNHLTVDVHGWKLRSFICYDLRFPIWCRNVGNQYDVAIFIANWPAKRAHHWRLLLPARAVENQSYVVGVNRVGKDGNGHAYRGDSSIIAPTGEILFQKADVPCLHTATLSYNRVKEFRESFAAWRDTDVDMIKGTKERRQKKSPQKRSR